MDQQNCNSQCKFCSILQNQDKVILDEGEDYFIIQDILSGVSAKIHILICPKQHIQSVNELNKIQHLALLDQLQEKAEEFLKKTYPSQQYHFGYHKPPYTSVKHLHLHGFVKPFYGIYEKYFKYGFFLHSTESIKSRIRQKL